MIERSGQNWTQESPVVPNLEVIEPTAKREKKRKKKAKGAKRQPFGFARDVPKNKRKRA